MHVYGGAFLLLSASAQAKYVHIQLKQLLRLPWCESQFTLLTTKVCAGSIWGRARYLSEMSRIGGDGFLFD